MEIAGTLERLGSVHCRHGGQCAHGLLGQKLVSGVHHSRKSRKVGQFLKAMSSGARQ